MKLISKIKSSLRRIARPRRRRPSWSDSISTLVGSQQSSQETLVPDSAKLHHTWIFDHPVLRHAYTYCVRPRIGSLR